MLLGRTFWGARLDVCEKKRIQAQNQLKLGRVGSWNRTAESVSYRFLPGPDRGEVVQALELGCTFQLEWAYDIMQKLHEILLA